MKLLIDHATRTRLEMIRAIGASQIRPVGLEADRLGRPVPHDDPFFARLIELGLGKTRWDGEAEAADRAREEAMEAEED